MNRPTTCNPLHLIDKKVAEQVMGEKYIRAFNPTSNLLLAWQVVCKMNELGYNVHVNSNVDSNGYYVVIHNGVAQGSDISPSVCVAICEAALSAVEWDKKIRAKNAE